ncbi:MAG: hypothetical protein RMZ41_031315 [Nostoc sp. DedVER02]|uniref:hypothetical protein n=1 Tax=unclassified Nostoc TaxID=2593658 RepID=UPI002AD4DB85|nr:MULTISPECIES: hypothetical protein [unclassified Nostoc]MDZ7989526.1 hypothetical protein [Nostoc sp. DedVER02]MDZ8116071.1 hypothetical protein [Nostoc sp. DedVER01b]
MQTLNIKPLEIVIPGSYYDSQIYDGKLYLWKNDGSITTLNWNKLIENINVNENLKLVLKFSVQYGDNLYNNVLFQDSDIKDLILKKFQELVENSIEISYPDLSKLIVSEQNNPLPFPHADSSIHYKTVYVGSQSGVSSSKCAYSRSKSLNPVADKLCDVPVVSLSASHLTLALAAGSEGLFDYYIGKNPSQKRNEPRLILGQHSNFVRWLYPSIFSSSYFNEGYFADFKASKKRKSIKKGYKRQEPQLIPLNILDTDTDENPVSIASLEIGETQITNRDFQKSFSSSEIFTNRDNNNSSIFTWGTHDKICLLTEKYINLVKFHPKGKEQQDKFISLGSIESKELLDDLISADSSFFGIVLEKEDGILVITSLLEYIHFPGEPVNWRLFPKSKNYTNQLHIIYEDRLCIYSFNHDFFVDQENKKIGISFGAS